MPELMQAVRKLEPGPGAHLERVPVPQAGPREVLVRVRAASICGTDYHVYSWDAWSQARVHPPITLGHEFAGEVVAIGAEVTSVRVGDHVSAETHIVDYTCPRCRMGEYHLCENTRIIGVDRDGAFTEYVALPEQNCWVNDPDLPFVMQSIQEPLGNAVHTVLAGEAAGLTVAVTGCGPIGLMAIPVVKMCGAEAVFAVDVNPYRLELARKMGADLVIDGSQADPVEQIRTCTRGYGCDVALEMSGHPDAIRQAVHAVRNGGRVSMLGLPTRTVDLDLANDVIMRGITMQGITGRRIWQTWFQVRALMRAGLADRLRPLITHTLPLDQIDQAMELMRQGQCGKVALLPGGR